MNLRERMFGYEDATPEEVAHLAHIRSRYLHEKVKYSLIFLTLFVMLFVVAAGLLFIVLPHQFSGTQAMILRKVFFIAVLFIDLFVSFWVTKCIARRTHPTAGISWLFRTLFCSRPPKEILDEFRQQKKLQKS